MRDDVRVDVRDESLETPLNKGILLKNVRDERFSHQRGDDGTGFLLQSGADGRQQEEDEQKAVVGEQIGCQGRYGESRTGMAPGLTQQIGRSDRQKEQEMGCHDEHLVDAEA